LLTDRSKVLALTGHGARLCVDKDNWRAFSDLDMKPCYEAEEAIERAKVVIDCTPAGKKNKDRSSDKGTSNAKSTKTKPSWKGYGGIMNGCVKNRLDEVHR